MTSNLSSFLYVQNDLLEFSLGLFLRPVWECEWFSWVSYLRVCVSSTLPNACSQVLIICKVAQTYDFLFFVFLTDLILAYCWAVEDKWTLTSLNLTCWSLAQNPNCWDTTVNLFLTPDEEIMSCISQIYSSTELIKWILPGFIAAWHSRLACLCVRLVAST